MGGTKLPMFEEEKVSSEGRDIILDSIISVIEHNPLYYLAIASIMLYSIMTFLFLQWYLFLYFWSFFRDHYHISTNPEV